MSKIATICTLIVIAAAAAACAFLYVRYVKVPANVAYISEEEGGIKVIDLNTLQVVRSVQPADIAPRGIGVTFDGKYLITADKNTADVAVFSTPRLTLVRRMRIGDNPEYIKMDPSDDRVFATFEPGSSGGPPASETAGAPPAAADDDDDDADEPPAQIATFSVPDWTTGPVSTAGKETEGLEFSADGKQMMVANEAQNTIGIFDASTGAHIRDVDMKPYGIRPRGVKRSPLGDGYAVTMEASGTLARLDNNFNVLKTVPTEAKPYGVAFDSSGKRIFVAAAMAKKLEVFSADTLQLLGEAPIGQRCWHFTFTPDDSKLLLACGRSNTIYVIDANTYQPITTIGGFKLPWGIVTYPRSYGTLGLP
jgi:YVTN family beta-propeller protein